MRLLVVNPNTSAAMTEGIRETARKTCSAGVRVEVVNPDFGPESLESFYDYGLAAFAVSRLLRKRREADGVLIACFGDPGLYGAKEICGCPVLGIAEASLSLGLLMGYKLGILAASEKAKPMMLNMAAQYGLSERLAGVWPLDMSVLDAERDKEETTARLISVGAEARRAGAEVLILGCAGMTGMRGAVASALAVPVLDPVECGCRMLELMVGGGYATSRGGLYAAPATKTIAREDLLDG